MLGKRLKCIGGLVDGQRVTMPEGQRHYEARKQASVSARAFDSREMPSTASVGYQAELYIVDSISGPHGEKLEFLRPESGDAFQALRHALT